MSSYDVIVIGLGAMGSATAYQLAKRDCRVLGLDARPQGHTEGSSSGRSRIIREAYAEGEEYVPLVRRAYGLWRHLERESNRNLLTVVGGLVIGGAGSDLTEGVVRSARRHDLPYEELSSEEASARFPGLCLADDLVAIFEPGAGILEPQACIDAHLEVADAHGADLRHAEPVRHWETDEAGVRVETDRGLYRSERLIVTAGPWSGGLLSDLGLPLSVKRVVNVHFECLRHELFDAHRFPVYILDVPEGVYYGLPALPGQGLKIGRHDGGEECTPETIRREVDQAEVAMLREVLDGYLPGAAGPVKRTLTCMYTMTPDGHFVIDRHGRIVYGCGFSGHGFKFAGVVGEILADLALEGESTHPIDLFSASRFATA